MRKPFLFILILALILPFVSLAQADPEFQTDRLMDGMAGVYYAIRFQLKEGQEGEFDILFNNDGSNGLPPGMKLSKRGGLYGNPQAAGTYTFRVAASIGKKETSKAFTLRVRPYDASKLNRGGTDLAIIGDGDVSCVGVANALNGGRVAINKDRLFYTNGKGFLYETPLPLGKNKPKLSYKAPQYRWLCAREDTLYYYQHYLDKRGSVEDGIPHTYVTRIVGDPIGKKGRRTMASIRQKDVQTLSLAQRVLLYIEGKKNGILTRVPLDGGREKALHCYHEGKELYALQALCFGPHAYFQAEQDRQIYRVFLDGELAEPLTSVPVKHFTIAKLEGQAVLCYTNKKNELFCKPLEGGEPQRLGKIKALQMNADETYLYLINPQDKNRPYRLNLSAPEKKERLAQLSCDQIYVFENALVLRKRKTNQFYLINPANPEKPQRINSK